MFYNYFNLCCYFKYYYSLCEFQHNNNENKNWVCGELFEVRVVCWGAPLAVRAVLQGVCRLQQVCSQGWNRSVEQTVVYLSVNPSIHLSVHLSIHPPSPQTIQQQIHESIHPTIIFPSIRLFVSETSIYLSSLFGQASHHEVIQPCWCSGTAVGWK